MLFIIGSRRNDPGFFITAEKRKYSSLQVAILGREKAKLLSSFQYIDLSVLFRESPRKP